MQVYELLESKEIKEEKIVDATNENNAWATEHFKADFGKFISYYTKEAKELVKEYNEFNRRFAGCKLPDTAQDQMTQIKQMLKFGQAAYRDEHMTSGAKPLTESVQYAFRKSWGDFPMYSDFIKELTKDMARLYKK